MTNYLKITKLVIPANSVDCDGYKLPIKDYVEYKVTTPSETLNKELSLDKKTFSTDLEMKVCKVFFKMVDDSVHEEKYIFTLGKEMLSIYKVKSKRNERRFLIKYEDYRNFDEVKKLYDYLESLKQYECDEFIIDCQIVTDPLNIQIRQIVDLELHFMVGYSMGEFNFKVENPFEIEHYIEQIIRGYRRMRNNLMFVTVINNKIYKSMIASRDNASYYGFLDEKEYQKIDNDYMMLSHNKLSYAICYNLPNYMKQTSTKNANSAI